MTATEGVYEFERDQWKAFKVKQLTNDTYVKIGDRYFQPVPEISFDKKSEKEMEAKIVQADGRIRRLNSALHMPKGKEKVRYVTYMVVNDDAKYDYLYKNQGKVIDAVAGAINQVHDDPPPLYKHDPKIQEDVYSITRSCLADRLNSDTNRQKILDDYQSAMISYLKYFLKHSSEGVFDTDFAPLTDEILFEAFTKVKELGEDRSEFVKLVQEGDIERYKQLERKTEPYGTYYAMYTKSKQDSNIALTEKNKARKLKEKARAVQTLLEDLKTELTNVPPSLEKIANFKAELVNKDPAIIVDDLEIPDYVEDQLTNAKQDTATKEATYTTASSKYETADRATKDILEEFKKAIHDRKMELQDKPLQLNSILTDTKQVWDNDMNDDMSVPPDVEMYDAEDPSDAQPPVTGASSSPAPTDAPASPDASSGAPSSGAASTSPTDAPKPPDAPDDASSGAASTDAPKSPVEPADTSAAEKTAASVSSVVPDVPIPDASSASADVSSADDSSAPAAKDAPMTNAEVVEEFEKQGTILRDLEDKLTSDKTFKEAELNEFSKTVTNFEKFAKANEDKYDPNKLKELKKLKKKIVRIIKQKKNLTTRQEESLWNVDATDLARHLLLM